MGLTTARLLQDAGWQVTIYSRDMLRRAHLPSRLPESRCPGYGVSFIENYYLGDAPPEVLWYLRELPALFTSVTELEPHQHPFPRPYVRRVVTMLVEPAVFLRRVRDDFLRAGGRFAVRDFSSREHLLAVDEPLIFNCTGLGARALFDDEEPIPAKGQLVLLPPDPTVDFMTMGGGSGVTYMFPRTGEILLGGSFQRGDWSRHAEPEVTERILADHAALFEGMG